MIKKGRERETTIKKGREREKERDSDKERQSDRLICVRNALCFLKKLLEGCFLIVNNSVDANAH